jgi:hypothetical protein
MNVYRDRLRVNCFLQVFERGGEAGTAAVTEPSTYYNSMRCEGKIETESVAGMDRLASTVFMAVRNPAGSSSSWI